MTRNDPLAAYHRATATVAAAALVQETALHAAIWHLRDDGHSIRSAAKALRLPKTTVARHWHTPPVMPSGPLTEDDYTAAYERAWGEPPEHVPWKWGETLGADGTVLRRTTAIPSGKAVRVSG